MVSLSSIGFNGHLNLGDDLMTLCLSWCATTHWGVDAFRGTTRYRLQPNPGRSPLVNKVMGLANDALLWRQVKGADVVLFGGGSMYHSVNSCRWKCELARRLRSAKGERALRLTIGVGVGPFSSEEEFLECKKAMASMDLVLVRDAESLEIVKRMGLDMPVHLCADPVFLLPQAMPELMSQKGRTSGEVLWVIRPDSDLADGGGLSPEQTLRIMREIHARTGLMHRMVVFNAGAEYGDLAFSHRLVEAADEKLLAPSLIYDGCNIKQILMAVRRSNAVVASRLHGIVVPFVLGTPVVPLSYHAKCEIFARESGVCGDSIQRVGAIDEARLVEDVVAGIGVTGTEGMDADMKQRLDVLVKAPADALAPLRKGGHQ